MRGVGDLFQDGSHGDEPVAGLGECIVKGELTGLPRAFRQFKWKETFFFFSFYSGGPYLFGTLWFEKASRPSSRDIKGQLGP